MSKKFPQYDELDLPKVAEEVLKQWEAEDTFGQSLELRKDAPPFVFYEGPPSANGLPGIHHVMARAIKDIFCRYQTQKGHRVDRKAGWDTHGLPIELGVEKELGITKEDIGKSISIEEYNAACKKAVMRYTDVWNDLTKRIGFWLDLEKPYVTYHTKYIESVWHLLKQLHDQDLLYKGYTIQPYSPAAGTGLSSHELNQPGTYKPVKDTSAVALFKVKPDHASEFLFKDAFGDVFIMAWTTTPWTLPSNTALTVGPKLDYVRVKTFNPYTHAPQTVVLAQSRLMAYFNEKSKDALFDEYKKDGKNIPWKVDGAFYGHQLEGIRYEQLLPYAEPEGGGDAFKVIGGDFVTTEDGTGVVHTAPSFGADDQRVARQHNIGSLTLVDLRGRFKPEVTDFAGEYVKAEYYTAEELAAEAKKQGRDKYLSVDERIAIKLKTEGRAFKVEKYEHNYPHCWRTDKPVLYYPLDSWFVRVTAKKDRLIALNKTINWKPESTGTGRFGNWLENLQDWNLSRSRYWGIPLPIWRNADATQEKCIGSVEQLAQEIAKANAALGLQQNVPADLHRPYIDDVVLVTDDGQPMRRELDLIDVWFDSGAMPYAQLHYPFENQDKFAGNFPADFISEGVDQTRGWFYTLHAIATMVFNSVAFKNVLSTGLVLDAKGEKMSKTKGNVANPFEIIAQYGADATRWYMMSNTDPWENLKFSTDGIVESRNKFFGTLFNTYNFFAMYAGIDKFVMDEHHVMPYEERPELDRWIISKLYHLVADFREAMDDYEPTKACRAIENFVDEHLSNWYVRLSRRRFWKASTDDDGKDKTAAYQTLFECLMVVSQLSSPVAPFFADWMYRNLTAPLRDKAKAAGTPLRHESVHLSDLTQPDSTKVDAALEQRMDYAQRICSLALSLRKREKLRVRQPLQKILLPILDPSFQEQVDAVADLIKAEINVKEIEYVTDTSGIITKKAKPNFKTLGKRLGKAMKAAADVIAGLSQEQINAFERSKTLAITVEGQAFDLEPEDLDIVTEDIPGWMVATDGEITVALDVTLTPELEAEGAARDLVNRIQNIRKERDYNVTDRIVVTVERHELVAPAIAQFSVYIMGETLADELNLTDELADGEAVELAGDVTVRIQVERPE
ncbi:MAG TPA: isoleucine--tRNA ligase [Flavobacteriales bacterium]|nr:isoleucine--tRNA ligase [Flavobacteriales bacterium]